MWKHRGWTFYSDRGLILPGTFETQASSTPGPREARTQRSIKQLTLRTTTLELDGQHSGVWGQDQEQGARGWGSWLRREVSGRTGSESAQTFNPNSVADQGGSLVKRTIPCC